MATGNIRKMTELPASNYSKMRGKRFVEFDMNREQRHDLQRTKGAFPKAEIRIAAIEIKTTLESGDRPSTHRRSVVNAVEVSVTTIFLPPQAAADIFTSDGRLSGDSFINSQHCPFW